MTGEAAKSGDGGGDGFTREHRSAGTCAHAGGEASDDKRLPWERRRGGEPQCFFAHGVHHSRGKTGRGDKRVLGRQQAFEIVHHASGILTRVTIDSNRRASRSRARDSLALTVPSGSSSRRAVSFRFMSWK